MTDLETAAKKALQEAAEALYFNDNSDFRSYFWQVIRALLPHVAPEFNYNDLQDGDLQKLLQKLDPEVFDEDDEDDY